MRALAVVALVACSSSPQPPALGNAAHDGGLPPAVERGGTFGLTARGLPAISRDGRQIVVALREPDGERGFANLTLIVIDRRDAEVARHVVLSAAEADQFLDDAEGKNPALDERVARANAWLAARALRTMSVTTAIRWTPSRLQIENEGERETPASWLPAKIDCERTARLGGAAIAKDQRVAVVTITYDSGRDFCPTPPDQFHVVTW